MTEHIAQEMVASTVVWKATMKTSLGFTLVELMLAVVLTTMILMGLGAMVASVYKSTLAQYHAGRVKGAEVMSLDALSRTLSRTTYMAQPNSPCPGGSCTAGDQGSDVLLGCQNYDLNVPGAPGVSANGVISASNPASVTVYQVCVDGCGNMWLKPASYPVLPPPAIVCPPTAVACDANSDCTGAPSVLAGFPVIKIAEQVSYDPDPASGCGAGTPPPPHFFCRRAGSANQVELHYQVGLGTAAVVVNTVVTTLKSLRSPTP